MIKHSYHTPVQVLACPRTAELELPSIHSDAMDFSPALRPAAPGRRQIPKQECDMSAGTSYRTPVQVLACPDTAELELPSIHSYGYGFQSGPAPSSAWPSPNSRIGVRYER